MDVPLGPDAAKFNDLLESAELKQSVIGPTHRFGHTLDLVIDHLEESMLSPLLETLSDLPSDHYGLVALSISQRHVVRSSRIEELFPDFPISPKNQR